MSKKNNKSIKARAYNHTLELERKQAERLAKKAEKNARKQQRREERAAAVGGVAKKTKKKAFRIRKGVQIKGIKVVDAESKQEVLDLLKAEAAAKMDADGPGAAAGTPAKAAKEKVKDKARGKLVAKKAKKAKKQAARPAAMET